MLGTNPNSGGGTAGPLGEYARIHLKFRHLQPMKGQEREVRGHSDFTDTVRVVVKDSR
jgi:hypothetical protein